MKQLNVKFGTQLKEVAIPGYLSSLDLWHRIKTVTSIKDTLILIWFLSFPYLRQRLKINDVIHGRITLTLSCFDDRRVRVVDPLPVNIELVFVITFGKFNDGDEIFSRAVHSKLLPIVKCSCWREEWETNEMKTAVELKVKRKNLEINWFSLSACCCTLSQAQLCAFLKTNLYNNHHDSFYL